MIGIKNILITHSANTWSASDNTLRTIFSSPIKSNETIKYKVNIIVPSTWTGAIGFQWQINCPAFIFFKQSSFWFARSSGNVGTGAFGRIDIRATNSLLQTNFVGGGSSSRSIQVIFSIKNNTTAGTVDFQFAPFANTGTVTIQDGQTMEITNFGAI